MIRLRPWQQKCLAKATDWLVTTRSDSRFLINAAPGAGKTIAACSIAQVLFELNEIDRVVVIAPRVEVVDQWAKDFQLVTGRHMSRITRADGDINGLGIDVCCTWSATQGLSPELDAVCTHQRVLVICDEHHHAAVEAAWGRSADSAFKNAAFGLILTGTPIRSDGAESVWLAYDNAGAIDQPAAGSYTLSYGEAVDLGYCRPATFHRHEGRFTVTLNSGESVSVSGQGSIDLPGNLKRIPGLQRALDFALLAKTPQFESDNVTPLNGGYQCTMMEWAIAKLNELRLRMPEAGGLVIAPDVEMAEYMSALIEMLEGEKPVIVHHKVPNPGARIKAFKSTDKRWLVSVGMVSEGVDIPRLRVLVYLPYAMTELAFRQAVGRVVRTKGIDDDTRAYVVMPNLQLFDAYARRVEAEMPASSAAVGGAPRHKRCPDCGNECGLSAHECDECGHEFPQRAQSSRPCPDCGALNVAGADNCHACGASLTLSYSLTLDEALRQGAIIRGADYDEGEVQEGEQFAPGIRALVVRSGDVRMIDLIQKLPDESFGRLKRIMDQTAAANSPSNDAA